MEEGIQGRGGRVDIWRVNLNQNALLSGIIGVMINRELRRTKCLVD